MEDAPGSAPPTESRAFEILFTRTVTIAPIAVVLLVAIATLPNLGVMIGFVFVVTAMLICVRRGGPAELGFRRPESWTRTIVLGVVIGTVTQVLFSIVIDPLLERATGTVIDVSGFDGIRGSLPGFLVMLAVGWVIGGFLEEMLFRGYLMRRLTRILGEKPSAVALSVLLPAISFGLAHSYQDAPGMLSTGLIAVLFGLLYVWTRYNLWLPIIVHGVIDTVGLTFIYLDIDKTLNHLLL